MIFGQVVPTFASQDGQIRKVNSDGVYMRSGPGTGYSIIMTMALGEALAYKSSTSGWDYCMGWNSGTSSIVNGYVSNGYDVSFTSATAKYALSLYSSESDSSYTGQDIPANAYLNVDTMAFPSYSNMYYMGITSWYSGGAVTYRNGFVHTNFRTTSPSSYYISF